MMKCILCELKTYFPGPPICFHCKRTIYENYNGGEAADHLFQYKGIIKKLIQEFREKQNGYCQVLVFQFLTQSRAFQEKIAACDSIAVIPNRKKWWLPYAPSAMEIIAKKIALQYKREFLWRLLLKKKHQQHTKSALERLDAPLFLYMDPFYSVETHKEKKILLLDDVYTTGTTIAQASHLLQNIGFLEIDFFTLSFAE